VTTGPDAAGTVLAGAEGAAGTGTMKRALPAGSNGILAADGLEHLAAKVNPPVGLTAGA
jgi:hypothetical protein